MNIEQLERGNVIKSRRRIVAGYIDTITTAQARGLVLGLRTDGGVVIAPIPQDLRNVTLMLLKNAYQEEAETLQKEFDNL